jgi:hypothetical protein
MVSQVETSRATTKASPSRRGKNRAAVASEPENHKTAGLAPETAGPAPVVVEAGSRSKSSLRHLEQGTGRLMHEVGQIVQSIHAAVPGPVPIVIVYREKRSSGSRSASPFGLLF